MDVREKLVELICDGTQKTEICTTDTYMDCETCRGDCGYCTILADHLIAHGVTVQEWVSVKDRLPEESGMYIVTANDGHAKRVSFVLWQKRNRMWSLTGARSYWRVTHWQPMPKPAKED